GGFELQLEVEWVKACRSTSQLAYCCLRQDSAGHQAPIGCLGRVLEEGDARSAADLLGEFADFQHKRAAYSADNATVIPRHFAVPSQEAATAARRLRTADTPAIPTVSAQDAGQRQL